MSKEIENVKKIEDVKKIENECQNLTNCKNLSKLEKNLLKFQKKTAKISKII